MDRIQNRDPHFENSASSSSSIDRGRESNQDNRATRNLMGPRHDGRP